MNMLYPEVRCLHIDMAMHLTAMQDICAAGEQRGEVACYIALNRWMLLTGMYDGVERKWLPADHFLPKYLQPRQ